MANGTIAASQIEMLSQSGTGIMTIVPPATNTNQTLTLPDSSGTLATLGTTLTLATAVTASGTAVDFTDIPSWVKRITVMFNGVRTNGTSIKRIQIGDSGGIETSGYAGSSVVFGGAALSTQTQSAGYDIQSIVAADELGGGIVLSLLDGNRWAGSGAVSTSTRAASFLVSGAKQLSDTLDRIRITTANGTDVFNAGTINIMYEG